MNETLDQLLDKAARLQQNGEFELALAELRRAHDAAPQNVEALHMLGSLTLQLGDLNEAGQLLERAAEIDPNYWQVFVNLSVLELRRKRFEDAFRFAQIATDKAGREPAAWKQLARIAAETGHHEAAGSAYARLAQLGVSTPAQELKCTLHFTIAGNFKDAAAALGRVPLSARQTADYFAAASEYNRSRGAWADMAAGAKLWLQSHPSDIRANEILAQALFEVGDAPGAADAFEPVLASGRLKNPSHHLTYGRICLGAQRFSDAETHIDAALAALPNSADALTAKARLKTLAGDQAAGQSYCRRALEQDASHIRAMTQLVATLRGEVLADDLRLLDQLYEQTPATDVDKPALAFALGDVAFRKQEADHALAHYQEGNALRRASARGEGLAYDRNLMEADIKLLIEAGHVLQGHEFIEDDISKTDPRLVFVTGMPRSGTTLVESILAAHPLVYGAGELPAGPKLLESFLLELRQRGSGAAANILHERRHVYRLQYLDGLVGPITTSFITDKMPGNALAMTLLATLFPTAKFLYCRRRAFDVAISIFRHQFPKAYTWSHSLDDIEHFFPLYARAAAQAGKLLDARFSYVDYDALVDAPETGLHEIVRKAGLEWADACTNFNQADRYVATFSSLQVRRPISKSNSDGGQLLRPLLEEYADALDARIARAH